ncbi:flavodoxin domain-containing protein [Rhodopirellula sp. P2]|uniref:flavodoxin domain-containing protein n=1 Tax=Rhodopirellula sp. P2 TaxID=2127060 RepID=UPI002368089D|nr:flavodoxin domain-containing protein [Rhodopirellula sp. P2]WDQ17253.1 flavodoxin domain-containing protein [Rhodopirellula sp. P2]
MISKVNAICLAALVFAAWGLAQWTEGTWWIAPPSASRWWAAAGSLAAYGLLCVWSFRGNPASQSMPVKVASVTCNHVPPEVPSRSFDNDPMLVIYASETGFAEELAQQTLDLLRGAGQLAELLPLDSISMERLQTTRQAFFLASTAGEGEPPAHACEFAEEVMSTQPDLSSLSYAVLAFGDSSYDEYCAFGRQIDAWLQQCGAQATDDRIDVDDADPMALSVWQALVEEFAGNAQPSL